MDDLTKEGEFVKVNRVIAFGSVSNYPLENGEFEVPVKGRTGLKRSEASAHLLCDGTIRINDRNNPEFWVEVQLPKEYVEFLHSKQCKK